MFLNIKMIPYSMLHHLLKQAFSFTVGKEILKNLGFEVKQCPNANHQLRYPLCTGILEINCGNQMVFQRI